MWLRSLGHQGHITYCCYLLFVCVTNRSLHHKNCDGCLTWPQALHMQACSTISRRGCKTSQLGWRCVLIKVAYTKFPDRAYVLWQGALPSTQLSNKEQTTSGLFAKVRTDAKMKETIPIFGPIWYSRAGFNSSMGGNHNVWTSMGMCTLYTQGQIQPTEIHFLQSQCISHYNPNKLNKCPASSLTWQAQSILHYDIMFIYISATSHWHHWQKTTFCWI